MNRIKTAFFTILILLVYPLQGVRADDPATSAMFAAVKSPDIPALDMAIENGANVNAADNQGVTALMLAVQNNDLVIAARLLDAGANINTVDANGDPAINWAAYYGYGDFVSLLLQRGATTNQRGHGNAREIAMRRGHQDLVRIFTSRDKTPVPTPDAAMLVDAVSAGDIEAVKDALAIGISANSLDFTGRPVLALAARHASGPVLQALIDKGATIDGQDEIGFTALMEASRDGNITAVRLLLAAGADVNVIAHANSLSLGAVHMAALSDNPEIVAAIAAAGANLNLQGLGGNTALIWCLAEGKLAAATKLLELGADATLMNISGTSAAQMIQRSNNKVLQVLLNSNQRRHP